MAGFLYFKPDTRPLKPGDVAKLGLGYAFTGGPMTNRPTNASSPSGRQGLVFAEDSRHDGKNVGYYPDQQTWRKLPNVEGRPELWVGYWNDAKPGPADLERKPLLPGEVFMTLGDGMQWLIPTLTEFDGETRSGECQLPAPLDYDEDGNLINGKPVGPHAQLWEAVHPVALGVCFGSNDAESDIKEATDKQIQTAAFSIIAANYVVSMPELVVLGALQNDATFRNIILASCRGRWLMDAVNELSKKNEPPLAADGLDTSDGKAA